MVPAATNTESELCPNSIPAEHSWDSAAALVSHFTATVNCCLGGGGGERHSPRALARSHLADKPAEPQSFSK